VIELTDHPTIYKPSEAEILDYEKDYGQDATVALLMEREQLIKLEKDDPYNHRQVLDHWKDAEALLKENDQLLISGGNRSGKTAFASWYIIQLLTKKPEARIACFSMTHQSSIRDQQPAVYEMLPKEFKKMKRTQIQNVRYTQKNGFSDGTFVLPNGSQCWFNAYQQPLEILEGFEADAIWFDELVPHSWFETAAYRLVTRKGKMLITATPITGYTPVYGTFVNGAEIKETRPAPLLENQPTVAGAKRGEMPYIMDCIDPKKACMFFFTEFNPYNPYDQMEKTLAGETSTQIKIRAYGYTDKSAGNFFPKFGKTHIIKPEKIPEDGTNYMCVDPAGSRNWSMLWLRVDRDGNMYVYREWPDLKTYGEWAVPAQKPEGAIGPAAKPEGRGLLEYKEIIDELEADESIEVRLIDPRAGGSTAATAEGGETLIDLLEDIGLDFYKAAGLPIEQGLSLINEKLNYNIEEPLSVLNQPALFISEDCGNLIDCMKEVTASGGDKNKWKDFVDCLRYLLTYDPIYVDGQTWKAHGVGGGY
tara:strand:+ start:255 stop:1853 length:1599 start_codon:yes stop_codon:yes gene_type:complete